MNNIIETLSTDLNKLSGKTAKGKDWNMSLQTFYLHIPGVPFPDKFEMVLPRDASGVTAPAYPVGKYELLSAVEVRDGRLLTNYQVGPRVTGESKKG